MSSLSDSLSLSDSPTIGKAHIIGRTRMKGAIDIQRSIRTKHDTAWVKQKQVSSGDR